MYRDEIVEAGALERLPELLPDGAETAVAVVGETSYEASGARARLADRLELGVHEYVAPSPNPSLSAMRDGLDLVTEVDPDVVLGVGGGSVLDTAKALSVLPEQPGAPREYVANGRSPEATGRPLLAVPTTAGTGSETTHFATIYVDGEKHSLVGTPVYPQGAVVDATLLESLPASVAATAGADALCQAIESYWSVRSTPASRTLAAEAISLAAATLERFVTDPTDESRTGMATAAHLAGKAIDVSKTTGCHSVSYPMTSHFDVPHGAAVALTAPAFLAFNADVTADDCTDPRGAAFVAERLDELADLLGASSPADAADRLRSLFDAIGLPRSLEAAGVSDLDTVVGEGFTPERMGNNPRRVTETDLRSLLQSIAD